MSFVRSTPSTTAPVRNTSSTAPIRTNAMRPPLRAAAGCPRCCSSRAMFRLFDFQATSNRSPKRNPPDGSVECDIREHSADDRSRRAQPGGLKNQVSGEQRANHVSQSRNQTDQGIETEPVARPGNDEGAVQQPAQCPEVLELGRLMGAEDRRLGARSRVLAHSWKNRRIR
jgi:hypothetical protein